MHASALLIMMPQLTTALYEPDRTLVPILGQVSTAERDSELLVLHNIAVVPYASDL